MKKFLVLGDVHIGDYPRFNNVANRLGQFNLLGERLCQLDADSVIIAGDLLLSCLMKPRVMHVVKTFIEKLCKRFDNVYYILGNHDLDVKLKKFTWNGDDTLVTLLDNITNFHYMHGKHLKVEDVDIYFMDWVKSHEVQLEDTCDVFISHVNLMPGFGQSVDNSKFKLGIFGDYHPRYQIKNMMTTGTPIQHYISDPIEPMVLELDIDGSNISTKWVPLENDEYKFIKMYRENEFPSNPTPYDILIKGKGSESHQEPLEDKVQFELSNDVATYLKDAGLDEEHSKVIQLHGDIEPVDMDFKINKLWAFNYRSIKELSYDFDENRRVTFLAGANGSGKSTFMRILISALLGDGHLKDKVTKGECWNEVGVVLTYQGRTHIIQRGNGSLKYTIDGVQQDANNMKSLQGLIDQNLGFTHYLWDFIVDSRATFFGKCDRLGLLTRLFELDRYSLYSDSANEIKNGIQDEFNGLTNELNRNKTEIDVYKGQITELESELGETPSVLDRSFYESRIKELTETETDLVRKSGELDNAVRNVDSIGNINESDLSQKLKDCNDELTSVESEIRLLDELGAKTRDLNRLNSMVNEGVKYVCEECGHHGTYKEVPESLLNEIDQLNREINDIKDKVKLSYSELKSNEISIKNKITSYQFELRKLGYLESAKSNVSRLNSEIQDILNKYGSLEKIKSEISTYTEGLKNLNSYLEKLDRINSLKSKLSGCESELTRISESQSVLSKKIQSYERYISLFDIYNMDSITNKILKKITSSISDDVMKFTTEKELKSGRTKFKVSCQLNVDGNWIDFDELSDGQQAQVSLKILSKLSNCLPKIGLVILDEPLKNVDENNLNSCIESLKTINCNNLLISSHSPSYNYADEVLTFELVDGVSMITKEIQ